MHPFLLPLALLGAGAYGVNQAAKNAKQPPVETLLESRRSAKGDVFQAFQLPVAGELLRALGSFALDEQPGAAAGRFLFKVVPANGEMSAAQAVSEFQAGGLVVLGSLSLVDLADDGDKYLLFCEPSLRSLAASGSGYALLLDVQDAVLSPADKTNPAKQRGLDQGIPDAVVAKLSAEVENPAPDTARLRGLAGAFETNGFPLAAAALRQRAEGYDLEKALLAAIAGEGFVSAAIAPAIEFPITHVQVLDTVPTVETPATVLEQVAGEITRDAGAHLNGAAKRHPNDPTPLPAEVVQS